LHIPTMSELVLVTATSILEEHSDHSVVTVPPAVLETTADAPTLIDIYRKIHRKYASLH
jgi:hypothetical protein